MTDRKPTPKIPAETILNDCLKTNGILLALTQPKVSYTNDGQMVIGKPNILAIYKEDAQLTANPVIKNAVN